MPITASNDKLDWIAPEFDLISVDDKKYNLNDLAGKSGTVIVFLCNHCPYVIKIIKKLVFESRELKKINVSTIAIMSNDVLSYPEDSFDNMKLFAKKYDFEFPYLYDHSQKVAKSYNAVCTPDIFGFNADRILKYRGRIDSDSIKSNNLERELFNAMNLISNTNSGPQNQFNSFGCSIKWRDSE